MKVIAASWDTRSSREAFFFLPLQHSRFQVPLFRDLSAAFIRFSGFLLFPKKECRMNGL